MCLECVCTCICNENAPVDLLKGFKTGHYIALLNYSAPRVRLLLLVFLVAKKKNQVANATVSVAMSSPASSL